MHCREAACAPASRFFLFFFFFFQVKAARLVFSRTSLRKENCWLRHDTFSLREDFFRLGETSCGDDLHEFCILRIADSLFKVTGMSL